jgi:hypothetical protein
MYAQMSNRDHVGKCLFDAFPVHNGLKQGNDLFSLLFSLALEYCIKKVQDNQKGLKLNGLNWELVYADVNLLGRI